MKRAKRILVTIALLAMTFVSAVAQNKIDEERMERDLEVAKNILSTMLRQQFDKRSFFPVEVHGSYLPGYGVTFKLPSESESWMYMTNWSDGGITWTVSNGGFPERFEAVEYPENPETAETPQGVNVGTKASANWQRTIAQRDKKNNEAVLAGRTKPKSSRNNRENIDSLKEQSKLKMLSSAKEFLADYGDLIGQLSANERIIVTNRGNREHLWAGFNSPKPAYLSVESSKGDLTLYKQGKITRDQLYGKLKVINSETEDELHPDLELMSSIINRLYRADLSKTFFTQENTYYERLKDFGVIYYLEVYSTNQMDDGRFYMPTVGIKEISLEDRDKKVKELYPLFTKSIKEDMLEYGRTLKSLKDDENLIFNIRMTRCDGCEIPASLEYSVKYSVLKDYSTGKLSMETALTKISEKKGPNQ